MTELLKYNEKEKDEEEYERGWRGEGERLIEDDKIS